MVEALSYTSDSYSNDEKKREMEILVYIGYLNPSHTINDDHTINGVYSPTRKCDHKGVVESNYGHSKDSR